MNHEFVPGTMWVFAGKWRQYSILVIGTWVPPVLLDEVKHNRVAFLADGERILDFPLVHLRMLVKTRRMWRVS